MHTSMHYSTHVGMGCGVRRRREEQKITKRGSRRRRRRSVNLKELLDINSDEEQDIWSLKPSKRRKVQAAFNMLSRCDDTLYELAQNIAGSDKDIVQNVFASVVRLQ